MMIQPISSHYKACSHLAQDHYENFPVASVLIPAQHRPSIQAIYAFARTADDFADEVAFEGRRTQELSRWRLLFEKCQRGETDVPLFIALADTIQKYQLPTSLFHDLLDAFEQDVHQAEHAHWNDILQYAKKSANPIGRLYLKIYGYDNPEMLAYSDAICSALQFANFWQDVSVDRDKRRVYIPTDNMKKHAYSVEQLYAGEENQAFRDMLKELVDQTQVMFDHGKALLPMLGGRLQKEIRMIVLGGEAVLQKIRKQNYNTLSQRPVLNRFDKVLMFCKAWLGYAA